MKTARVLKVDPHADAKKLSVVEISDGVDTHQLICGAPNVVDAVGQVVAWVQPGTTLPNGAEIRVAEIGVVSHGMLASEQELGLSEEHEGILVLPAETPIGKRLGDAIPIEDWVWEVDNKAITHRADLWGHMGIAREVSMLTNRLNSASAVSFGARSPVDLDIELPDGCKRYLALELIM